MLSVCSCDQTNGFIKSQITLNNVVYKSKVFASCYRLVNVISDGLAQPVITLSSLCHNLKTL